MPPRLYVDLALDTGADLTLPPDAARHVQVLRLQPGDGLTLFNGSGPEWSAEVRAMGRKDVAVGIGPRLPARDCERPVAVTLAVGMPANERMDALVEKATELGAAGVQPLHCARSVLRLSGERADKRRSHWQGVATAASEQSGRTRVPAIGPVAELRTWLASLPQPAPGHWRGMLSLATDAQPLGALLPQLPGGPLTLLSGPEGGLSPEEEAWARQAGFVPVSLGPRVLRADTAPLAALALLGLDGR